MGGSVQSCCSSKDLDGSEKIEWGAVGSETEAAITSETMGGTIPYVKSPGLAMDALKLQTDMRKEPKEEVYSDAIKKVDKAVTSLKEGDSFEVTLDRTNGARIGVDVDHVDHVNLIIVNISGGLVAKWNEENPEKELKLGYKIAEVNGISGDVDSLVDECKETKILRMKCIVSSQKPTK